MRLIIIWMIRNIFRYKNFYIWLLKEARFRGYYDFVIENNIIYFISDLKPLLVFSPLERAEMYRIKSNAEIDKHAFGKRDIVYRVYRDGTMSLVQSRGFRPDIKN